MADISKIKLPDGVTYNIKDATARGYVTGVKGNAESSYRTGQVNLTPNNIGAIGRTDELLTTNPFAPRILKGPYISKIDNAFYCADKRWNVSITNVSGTVSSLFDGDYDEGGAQINGTSTAVVTFDFANGAEATGYFPGYPYGNIIVNFYYVAGPASITGRVYCNYSGHGVGWHDITFTKVTPSDAGAITYIARNNYYQISKLEISVKGDTSNSYGYTRITEIEMHLDRPMPSKTPFLSKYNAEKLYYSLTAPSFYGQLNGNVAGNASTATRLGRYALIGSDNADTQGWYKWAEITMSGYGNYDSIFAVTTSYGEYRSGILRLNIRSDNTSVSVKTLGWLARQGFAVGDIVAVVNGMNVKLYINRTQSRYGRTKLTAIQEGNINGIDTELTLLNNTTKESTAPTATVTATDISVPNVSIATGTLPVANGGTGKTTAQAAANNLLGGLDNSSAQSTVPTDDTSFITTNTTGTTGTYYHRKASLLWDYIKNKISSILGLTATNYGGTSAKATADASGNTITSHYAPKSTAVTNVALATNKITKTINGTTTDVVTSATTSAYGITKLNSATNSTSTTEAATPSAVKTAYDLANTANGTANTALSGVNGTLIYDHTYSISNGVATFTAHVYQKGVEVTNNYADSCFEWSYKLASAVTGTPSVVSLGTGKTKTITISTLGYGGYVLGTFTPPSE